MGRNENITKIFDKTELFPYAFVFQEAVEKLEDSVRYSVDVHVLLISFSILEVTRMSAAEENCICQREGFGCVIVLAIETMKTSPRAAQCSHRKWEIYSASQL